MTQTHSETVGDSRFIRLDSARFHYLECGDPSNPPLVFLHGIFSAAADYGLFLSALAQKRHVLALDQRGHGQTEHADGYSWTGSAQDFEAFVSRLGLGQFDLIGYSMGAYIALMFAAAHPGSVGHLVLVEGGLEWPNSDKAKAFWGKLAQVFSTDGFSSQEAFVEMASDLFPRADRDVLTETAHRFVQRSDGRWDWPHRADQNVFSLTSERPEGYAPMPSLVRCPTLVIRAEHSELFTGDYSRHIAAQMQQAEVRVLPNCGHLFMWERAAETSAQIDRFLQEHQPTSDGA